MTTQRRRLANETLTEEQIGAQIALYRAINDTVDAGLTVPCTDDIVAWDDATSSPDLCTGCPVLEVCTTYAQSGAVRHGIVAGRRMTGAPAGVDAGASLVAA